MANNFGALLDDAIDELKDVVEEAQNFMTSEYSAAWETGERYYAGKCDLPRIKGRSSIVKTEARDVIRAIMPNVMRVLLQSNKPVEYMPSNIRTAAYSEQQAHWINQLFMANGGYQAIYDSSLESMKLKSGPVKCYWEEAPHPEHVHATGLSAEQVVAYQETEDLVVDSVEEMQSPTGGLEYEIRATRYYENGKITFEAFPMYEFFHVRGASDLSGTHGHRRSVTVSEAIEMGLEHEDWRTLDNNDPQTNDGAEAETIKRGHNPDGGDDHDTDIMNHEFLLSETYCSYDLDGDGVPEYYVFYLGGTNYEYLHHEQIEGPCIAVVNIDPQPFTVVGRSIIDISKQSTDNATSVLRSIVDNAHQANNARAAADPTRTNFHDLMNNAIGAPIRTKGDPKIQYTDTPFTGQGMLPFLDWLTRDAENKVGVTKAATGLDPDAMQSTDKQAVQTTIQLSQGQTELMVRNIVHSGLIPLFKIALRLATRHMPKRQIMKFKGEYVPVDVANFDPNLAAIPNVGLGTSSPEQKLQTLMFIYGQQKEYMTQFGMDNPFTSLSKVYNTLEDIIELGGMQNAGRYFAHIDNEAEAVIAKNFLAQQAKAAEANRETMPLDPGKALYMTEQLKVRAKTTESMNQRATATTEQQLKALIHAEEMDYKRDMAAQDRIIELAKLEKDQLNAKITREQDSTAPRAPEPEAPASSDTPSQQP